MLTLNSNITMLESPPIPTIQAWGKAYNGAKGPLIDLSQAVPGYPPHPTLLAFLSEQAASITNTGYGEIEGEQALRQAFADDCSSIYNAAITAQMALITSGCNQAFVCAALAVAKPGDSILMSNPGYFNHETTLAMLGLKVDRFDCHAADGFLPTVQSIAAAIRPNTRALALVSPNNPTGAVYPASLLNEILALCRVKNIWLILDETYRDFLEPKALHQLFQDANWNATLISLHSFSKSYCIPGHRLGAIIASPQVVTQIAKIMDNLQICAPRSAQAALAKAMPLLKEWRNTNRSEIQNRAYTLKETFAKLPQWHIASCGAYFAFVKHPFNGTSAADVAKRLALENGILTLPGSYFGNGLEGYLRFAFANADCPTIASLTDRLI